MSNRFRLLSMQNDELVAGLSQLVQRSNELTGDLLAHLAELEVPEREHTRAEASAQPSDTVQREEAADEKTSEVSENRDLDTTPPSEAGAATPPRRRELEALSIDRFGVHFTADTELRELIERARALASHRLPNNDLSSLMRLVLTSFVKTEEARRFAAGRKPRRGKAATPPGGVPPVAGSLRPAHADKVSKRSRHVPAAVRRAVYLRDQGRCSFVSEDGQRCEASAFLELDHIEPWAALWRRSGRQHSAALSSAQPAARSELLWRSAHCFEDR